MTADDRLYEGINAATNGRAKASVSVASDVERLLDDLTDAGNADWLVSRRGHDLLYQYERSKWRHWDGVRWVLDQRGEVFQIAEGAVREQIEKAATLPDVAKVKQLTAHAKSSLNRRKFEAILAMAEAKLPANRTDFDRDDDALGVANGIVDLRSGAFRAARRADMLSRVASARFIAGAEAPQWLNFLDRIFAGDHALISFVQRAIGYSCSGRTTEQCFFPCFGQGANGKSTFFHVVGKLLADYAYPAPFETFLARPGDRATNDLAAMDGSRFVTASEPEEGRHLASGLMKQLTGEDPVTARFMYQEFFTYLPRYKIWLATNHKLPVNDASDGMWRRVRLIPFSVKIPEAEQDGRLRERLADEELSGILNWAIAGAIQWYEGGLRPPEAVMAATDAYHQEMDRVGNFIGERCEVGDQFSETIARLHADYVTWSRAAGDEPLNSRAFATQLDRRGFAARRTKDARLRGGIQIRAVTDDAR